MYTKEELKEMKPICTCEGHVNGKPCKGCEVTEYCSNYEANKDE